MRISKYIKLDTNILMEYIYDDSNLISEPYVILVNTKNSQKSYVSTSTSGSLNTLNNQLFTIDPVSRTYGIDGSIDSSGNIITNYPFLQANNYASGFPLRFDTITLRLPINYTFGQYIGFYLRAYAFDYNNNKTYDLCNFFFDITNVNTKSYINYTNPPILYQEQLWGKEIDILIPSLFQISNQRTANLTTPNSVNYNLTGGVGLNQQSPLFFEFSFINTSQTISGVTTYLLAPKILANLPQVPEFQRLGVVIQHSSNGDFFEIYGTYNGNIADFNTFINNSVYLGNHYYVNYIITVYEQNIRISSQTITVTDNFNTPIEYRPIIKYSSTTAIIDVEMDVIDSVDNSSIVRKASYGMLQDEVSKYSVNLTKINLASSMKPKIYNLKSAANTQLNSVAPINSVETVNVPFALLSSNANIVAKSDNVISGSSIFYGDGNLRILLKPFDNVLRFSIARDVTSTNGVQTPNYMDLSSMGQIQLVFKNTQTNVSFDIYSNNSDINLANGVVVFLVPTKKLSDIRLIYNSGVNVFYITSTQQGVTSVIYSGLFELYDSPSNINNLTTSANNQLLAAVQPAVSPSVSTSADTKAVPNTRLIKTYINSASLQVVSPALISNLTEQQPNVAQSSSSQITSNSSTNSILTTIQNAKFGSRSTSTK